MKSLIEKLEAAEAGSRELDAEIWLAVTPGASREQWSYIHKASGQECFVDETRAADKRLIIVPEFSTSLDAALTLVPEGLCWMYDSALCYGEVFDIGTSPITKYGSAASPELESCPPALALCIAALKARDDDS